MADFGEFFRRMFTMPGAGATEAGVLNELSRARTTAEETLRKQSDLLKRAQANTMLPEDSEAARLAADARLRNVLASGFSKNFQIPGGFDMVGSKTLFGM